MVLVYTLTIVSLASATEYTTHAEYTPFYVSDFSAFLMGAYIIRYDTPSNLYTLNVQRDYLNQVIKPYIRDQVVLTYRNPPLLAILFLPFTFMEPKTAFKIYVALSAFIIALGAFILSEKLKLNLIVTTTMAFVFFPVISTLLTGQISSHLFLLLCLIYICILNNNFTWAGLLSSLLLLKPQHILLIPLLFLAVKLNKKYLISVVIGCVLFIVINTLIFGVHFLPEYIPYLLTSENHGMGADIDRNFSFMSLILLFTPNPVKGAIALSAVVYSIFLLYYLKANKNTEPLIISAFLVAFPSELHVILGDLTVLLIPIAILLSKYYHTKNRMFLLLVIYLFFLPFIFLLKVIWISGFLFIIAAILILKTFNSISHPNH